MGATIVDSLDTLHIMGLKAEYEAGREWVAASLDLSSLQGELSVFETNIRYIGGLLAAFSLTGDELFKVYMLVNRSQ